MTNNTVISFNRKRFSLRLDVLFRAKNVLVWLPKIGHVCCIFMVVFYFLIEFIARANSACSNLEAEEPFPEPINCRPDPIFVFFTNEKVNSSSISMIGAGAEISSTCDACSPYFRTQLYAETWLIFSSLPICRNPFPSRYNCSANFFRTSGFPTSETVYESLQSLQWKRWRPPTIPNFMRRFDLHFGQSIGLGF